MNLFLTNFKSIASILTCTLFTIKTFACNVDIQIHQGNSVTVCPGEQNNISATSGMVSYTWTGPVIGNGFLATPTSPGWIYVEGTDNTGCVSKDSILVSFHSFVSPIINSSEGLTICSSVGGTTLSLNNAYDSYLWNDGSSNPTLFANQGGDYSVIVSDANGCQDTASISIDFIQFNLQAIGGNTVCEGSAITLEASGGDIYAWSTNEFTSSIVVSPTESTTYTVTIYKGACNTTLSITVDVTQLPPSNLPDTVYVFPGEVKYAYGPANFDTYVWSPESLVSTTSGSSTAYTGSESGSISVVATSNSLGCSIMHSTYFKFLELTIPEGFSPNRDGINDNFEIPEIYEYSNATLKVWNRWGDIVFESDNYRNEWDGKCKGQFCAGSGVVPEGTYYYILSISGYEFKGFITIKL